MGKERRFLTQLGLNDEAGDLRNDDHANGRRVPTQATKQSNGSLVRLSNPRPFLPLSPLTLSQELRLRCNLNDRLREHCPRNRGGKNLHNVLRYFRYPLLRFLFQQVRRGCLFYFPSFYFERIEGAHKTCDHIDYVPYRHGNGNGGSRGYCQSLVS